MTLPRYRKKPVEVVAVQMVPGNDEAITDFMRITKCPFVATGHYELMIRTREGTMHVSEGDWIIQGVFGEFYPCKPDVFDATYEPVVNDGNDVSTEAPTTRLRET